MEVLGCLPRLLAAETVGQSSAVIQDLNLSVDKAKEGREGREERRKGTRGEGKKGGRGKRGREKGGKEKRSMN